MRSISPVVASNFTPNCSSITSILAGHRAAYRDLGLEVPEQALDGLAVSHEYCEGVFDAWRASHMHDPDLARDQRMMVPVVWDKERELMKVWMFLGYTSRPLSVTFAKKPEVVWIRDHQGAEAAASIRFVTSQYRSVYPVMAEIYVKKVLDREEFRRVYDQLGNCESVIGN